MLMFLIIRYEIHGKHFLSLSILTILRCYIKFQELMGRDNLEIFGGDLNVEVNGQRAGSHERRGREIFGEISEEIAVNVLKNEVTNPKTGTKVDILFVNKSDRCSGSTKLKYARTSDYSDHIMTYVTINFRSKKPVPKKLRSKLKIKQDDEDLTKFANLTNLQRIFANEWNVSILASSFCQMI